MSLLFLFLVINVIFLLQISSVLRGDCDALHFSRLFCSSYRDGGGFGHDFVLLGSWSTRWDSFSLLWSSSAGNRFFIVLFGRPVLELIFACWQYCAMLIVRGIYALSVSYILYMFYREFWLTICPAWTSSICFARVMRNSSIVRVGSITRPSPTLWSLMFRFLSRIVVCHGGVMAGPEVLEPELEDTVSPLTNDQCFSIWTISTSQWTFSAYIFIILFKPISDFVVCYLKF